MLRTFIRKCFCLKSKVCHHVHFLYFNKWFNWSQAIFCFIKNCCSRCYVTCTGWIITSNNSVYLTMVYLNTLLLLAKKEFLCPTIIMNCVSWKSIIAKCPGGDLTILMGHINDEVGMGNSSYKDIMRNMWTT